jgi:hypothetical protein
VSCDINDFLMDQVVWQAAFMKMAFGKMPRYCLSLLGILGSRLAHRVMRGERMFGTNYCLANPFSIRIATINRRETPKHNVWIGPRYVIIPAQKPQVVCEPFVACEGTLSGGIFGSRINI